MELQSSVPSSAEQNAAHCWHPRRWVLPQWPSLSLFASVEKIRVLLGSWATITLPFPRLMPGSWVQDIQWFNLVVIVFAPSVAIYGAFTTAVRRETALLCFAYYLWNMLGYHRLWSHRAYNARLPLQYFLAIAGVGAVQGSIQWWSRHHRAHHRYTDTDKDPYGAHRGLWWSHLGWMLVKPETKHGVVDISDLRKNVVVRWQHRWFFPLALLFGMILPTCVAGYLWDDWRGGFFFAGFLRLTCVHHSVFCVNSLAHWLGETTFDDRLSPRDHLLTAILTLGEGYHNFHHQFPMDYRNAVEWYQWDPTKWFIAACSFVGLATHLRSFPHTEIKRSRFTMRLKKLKEEQGNIPWPAHSNELPIIDWEAFQKAARGRQLILVSGFIHEVGQFAERHPGGRFLLDSYVGKDATAAFFGGTYEHSNAAHNLLSTMRVGALHGGLEVEHKQAVPPGMRLRIVEWPTPRATPTGTHDDGT